MVTFAVCPKCKNDLPGWTLDANNILRAPDGTEIRSFRCPTCGVFIHWGTRDKMIRRPFTDIK